MEVFHLRPSGPLLCLNRSSVDSRAPSASAALMPCLSISEKLLILRSIARVSPSSRMLYMAMRYIPLIFSRVNRRLLDLTLKPPAAALAGSSVSVPMDTVPSATSVRNLIAAL